MILRVWQLSIDLLPKFPTWVGLCLFECDNASSYATALRTQWRKDTFEKTQWRKDTFEKTQWRKDTVEKSQIGHLGWFQVDRTLSVACAQLYQQQKNDIDGNVE